MTWIVDIMMPMHNFIGYICSYSKISGNLWQQYRDKSILNNSNISEYDANNTTTESFKLKEKQQDKQVTIQVDVAPQKISQDFRSKNIDKIRNNFIEEEEVKID